MQLLKKSQNKFTAKCDNATNDFLNNEKDFHKNYWNLL